MTKRGQFPRSHIVAVCKTSVNRVGWVLPKKAGYGEVMCFFLEELGAHTVNRGVEWLENESSVISFISNILISNEGNS
jgi:hypothetical protein